jgi:hypothetical protein
MMNKNVYKLKNQLFPLKMCDNVLDLDIPCAVAHCVVKFGHLFRQSAALRQLNGVICAIHSCDRNMCNSSLCVQDPCYYGNMYG